MILYKEYHPHPSKTDGTEIKMSISYNKGVGYRISCFPVKRSKLEGGFGIEEFEAFTGFNDTLLEAERQSKGKLENAINILKSRMEKYLSYFENAD